MSTEQKLAMSEYGVGSTVELSEQNGHGALQAEVAILSSALTTIQKALEVDQNLEQIPVNSNPQTSQNLQNSTTNIVTGTTSDSISSGSSQLEDAALSKNTSIRFYPPRAKRLKHVKNDTLDFKKTHEQSLGKQDSSKRSGYSSDRLFNSTSHPHFSRMKRPMTAGAPTHAVMSSWSQPKPPKLPRAKTRGPPSEYINEQPLHARTKKSKMMRKQKRNRRHTRKGSDQMSSLRPADSGGPVKRLYINPRDGQKSVSLAALRFGKKRRKRPRPRGATPASLRNNWADPDNSVESVNISTSTVNLSNQNYGVLEAATSLGGQGSPDFNMKQGFPGKIVLKGPSPSERIGHFFSPHCGTLSPRTLEIVRLTLRAKQRKKVFIKFQNSYSNIANAKDKQELPPTCSSYDRHRALQACAQLEDHWWASASGRVLTVDEIVKNHL